MPGHQEDSDGRLPKSIEQIYYIVHSIRDHRRIDPEPPSSALGVDHPREDWSPSFFVDLAVRILVQAIQSDPTLHTFDQKKNAFKTALEFLAEYYPKENWKAWTTNPATRFASLSNKNI